MGNFAILAFVDPIGIVTTPSVMEIFESQGHGSLCWLLVNRVWNGGSDLQAGVDIYYWEHPEFWLISSSQNDPILEPQFPPSVWAIGGPIFLFPPKDPGPNSKLYTQI